MRIIGYTCFLFVAHLGLLDVAVASTLQNREVIEQLVSCRAPLSSAVAFGHAVDSPGFDLTSAEEYAPWGGLAWKVDPPIKLGSVSSNIVIMETNRSFYLRVPSKDPGADIRAVAKTLSLTVDSEKDNYLVYRKALTERTIEVQSTENTDDFWVGCFYDQEAFSRMEESLYNAIPAVIKKADELKKILEAE